MGQTTDFRKDLIKSNVLILGESNSLKTARYNDSAGFFRKLPWGEAGLLCYLLGSF
jgi:hypothetical protein